MVLIFDLDDTLYVERSYVHSGFAAVAAHLQQQQGWPAAGSLALLKERLQSQGRGALFDHLLHSHGQRATRQAVADCVRVYRHHRPTIALHAPAERLLARLPQRPYVVTDGHKVVQQLKLQALGLWPRLTHAYITHRYGLQQAKPSTHCFELIRAREGCSWSQMAYVGDNPAKDFVNLTPLGVHTVRVRTGEHAQVQARPGYEARHTIDSLDELPALWPDLPWAAR